MVGNDGWDTDVQLCRSNPSTEVTLTIIHKDRNSKSEQEPHPPLLPTTNTAKTLQFYKLLGSLSNLGSLLAGLSPLSSSYQRLLILPQRPELGVPVQLHLLLTQGGVAAETRKFSIRLVSFQAVKSKLLSKPLPLTSTEQLRRKRNLIILFGLRALLPKNPSPLLRVEYLQGQGCTDCRFSCRKNIPVII